MAYRQRWRVRDQEGNPHPDRIGSLPDDLLTPALGVCGQLSGRATDRY
jgi:hypothetical protein